MKNNSHHGYSPAPGFLPDLLAKMRRFHDVDFIPELAALSPSLNTSLDSLSLNTQELSNPVNLPLQYLTSDPSEPVCYCRGRSPAPGEPTIMINGTPIVRTRLQALVTPLSLYGKRIRFSVLEYEPLMDSSNMVK